ncbi:MAG: rod shape-determining protein MreB [bacterium]|nr:rod shape-determining protein MreB [bacterium]
MLVMTADIGIDLGTASVKVYVRGKGIVLREPSVVAIEKQSGKVVAIGTDAKEMVGRTPGNIVALRPLREGVIDHFDLALHMLKHYVGRVCGRAMLLRPRVVICVPSGVTSVERRAVLEAATQAGARRTYLIEEPLAAALGAGIDIGPPSGSMVVDIGGGTSDIAVLSLGGIVHSISIRVGGDRFDESLIRHVRREHNLLIGERTAEEVKIEVATAFPDGRAEQAEVRGRDLVTGLPRTIIMTSEECRQALEEPLQAVLVAVREVLEATPPELAADIIDRGMMLTGGGALLHGLDRYLAESVGVPVLVAEDPISCVALGTGKALESLTILQSLVERRVPGAG